MKLPLVVHIHATFFARCFITGRQVLGTTDSFPALDSQAGASALTNVGLPLPLLCAVAGTTEMVVQEEEVSYRYMNTFRRHRLGKNGSL